jgi:tetraacyldisaccharide 4'-kinase
MIYGFIVSFRNFLFDIGFLRTRQFKVPIICVGNITVGGTGKTPHTELLIAELKKKFKVACLSRGYKRKSSGFIIANEQSTASQIGDEPFQMYSKFPDITMACDGNRVRGIEKLLAQEEAPEVIILDDAFQHRYVQADKNIVLIDYNRPISEDYLLPMGRLRESAHALKRADYIIVTKCPHNLSPIERRVWNKQLDLGHHQQLFFTRLGYEGICHLTGEAVAPQLDEETHILCIVGIAEPTPYIEHLQTMTPHVTIMRYPDHHHFTSKEIQQIEKRFEALKEEKKYIFTTEKDAARLKTCHLTPELKNQIFYIPVRPIFLQDEELFLTDISEYVRKNQA